MRKHRIAPGGARLRIAERVELEDRAGDPKLFQKLIGEGEQFDVGLRFCRADDLGIELVKLAEAALLRPFIAEGRAGGRELERRILLPPFAEIGAAEPPGELGPKRDRYTAALFERIHL